MRHLTLLMLAFSLSFSTTLRAEDNTRYIDNAWQMPDLERPDLSGRSRQLSEWSGQVILLNFWATWCPPCLREIPRFVEEQERLAGRGLSIVSVGLDEAGKLKEFAARLGINYPVLVAHPSRDLSLLDQWGDPQRVLPFTVIIGRDGHLHFMRHGEFDQQAMQQYVMPLLDAEATTQTARVN